MNGTFSGLLPTERNLPQPIGMCPTDRELSSFLSLCLVASLILSQIRHKVVALPLIGTLYSFRFISNPLADPSSPSRQCFEHTLRCSAREGALFVLSSHLHFIFLRDLLRVSLQPPSERFYPPSSCGCGRRWRMSHGMGVTEWGHPPRAVA